MVSWILQFLITTISNAIKAAVLWYVLQVIGNWKILSKAGKPGWHCLIPIINLYEEYDVCWKGKYGIYYTILGMAASVISFFTSSEETTTWTYVLSVIGILMFLFNLIESNKLSKSYGRGIFFTLGLITFNRIFRIILGISSWEYRGKDL